MTDLRILRGDRSLLAAELRAAGAVMRGPSVVCPFHDDHSASGSIHCKNGVWRYTCHASSCGFSGDILDVRSRRTGEPISTLLGPESENGRKRPTKPRTGAGAARETGEGEKTASKQFSERESRVFATLDDLFSHLGDQVVSHWAYSNPEKPAGLGAVELVVFRLESEGRKWFSQASQVPGGWVQKAPPKPWPIYNRIGVRDADRVLVVEGEKCATAIRLPEVALTTAPCGAGAADKADWSPLAGKTVYLWPDNDDAGKKHMVAVANRLAELNPMPTVFWIDPTELELGPKGDLADFVASIGDPTIADDAVLEIIADAKPVGPSAEVEAVLNEVIRGNRRTVPLPWRSTNMLTRALFPGTVTLVCGDAGSRKSLFVLEAAAHWFASGILLAIYELEEDRAYHLNRSLVQRTRTVDLMDDDWITSHPDQARKLVSDHRGFLDAFGRSIWDAPDTELSLTELQDWAEQRMESGCRIIIIDPITVAKTGNQRWTEDHTFILGLKRLARKHDASVILVTHPKEGPRRGNRITLGDVSGGASYTRLAQCVLWICSHQTKRLNVDRGDFIAERECNMTVKIVKARNGSGSGLDIGYWFNPNALTFEEQGPIEK